MRYSTRPSAFKHMITFLTPTEVSDGMGSGGDITWADSDIRGMAAIRPLKGVERIEALKHEHVVTHRIIVRYVSGLSNKMRVRVDMDSSRVFEIVGGFINREEENLEIEFFAEELTDGL